MDIKRKQERRERYTLGSTFRLKHYYQSLPKCRQNVGWKSSVQNYMATCVDKIYNDFLITNNGRLPPPSSDKEQIIRERGKPRAITPIHIRDRENQKVLCDFALTPGITPHLIYDNGASLSGKGVEFTRKRVMKHLHTAIKEYGPKFYILMFDFKGFFDSIPHKTCLKVLRQFFADEGLVNVSMDAIKSPYRSRIKKMEESTERSILLQSLNRNELRGICLGSQVSQIMALAVANDLDHYIKDIKRFKYYIRYMDDGVVFAKTKIELRELFNGMKSVADKLGLRFNEKKTHIVASSNGFTFLKVQYRVKHTGRILRKLTRDSVVRMRRKLKKFRKKVDEGHMSYDDVYNSLQSWLAHAKVASSYHSVRSMLKLYKQLFGGYRIMKGGDACVLQADRWAEYRWCS